jgi:hypothetical protein
MLRKLLLSVFFICTLASAKAETSYSFCIQSEQYESFKATLVFESVDFGKAMAQLILKQQLESKLGCDVNMLPFFSDKNCGCAGETCQEIKLRANKIQGKFKVDQTGDKMAMPAAAIGTVDKIVTEAQKMIDNPESILQAAIKQGTRLLDKILD